MASLHLANEIFKLIYPVGSIYISTSSTNPSSYFGGTWTAVAQGRTLIGVNTSDSDFNTVMKTGGSKTHTLTINEMPSHAHSLRQKGDTYNHQWTHWANYNSAGVIGTYQGSGANLASVETEITNTGGNTAHSILNPYYTVYIFRRTA